MKKILIIILLLLSIVNVNAIEGSFAGREYLSGIAYTKYDGITRYYRNAMAIMNNSTNQVAYCIEPFSLLIDNTNYFGGTGYDPRFGIDVNKWEKIKLYAYYGYGYENHTDKKWISITQLTIWRELYPNYDFNWIDDVKSRNVIFPYENEINELKRLVTNHNIIPSFKNSYEIGINEELKLIDENNVLNNYDVSSNDFDFSVDNNILNINAKSDEMFGTITFKKNKNIYSDDVVFFYNESSQNLMQIGNLSPINYEIKIKVNSGKIIVNKVDQDTMSFENQGKANLDGAEIELLDENMNLIESKTIFNNVLMFDNLKYGKYYIRESKAGNGYYLNNKIYEVTIDNDNLEPVIVIENNVIKSKVKVTKYFGTKSEYEQGKMQKEKDIKIQIYDDNNKLIFEDITKEDGTIETTLPYGDYVLKQINTTEGYEKVDDYRFSINEDNSNYYEIGLYDLKIETFNASFNIFDYLINASRWLCYD